MASAHARLGNYADHLAKTAGARFIANRKSDEAGAVA